MRRKEWTHPAPLWTAMVLASACLVLPRTAAASCDLCSIYTGSLMQMDKTGLMLSVGEQYTKFGTVQDDGRRVRNVDGEWVRSSVTQLSAGWAFTPRLGVQAVMPLISREYRRLEDGMPARGDVGGLGDMLLLGRWAPLSRPVGESLVHVEFFAGIKLPTGDSDRLAEEAGGHHGGGGHDDDGHDDHSEDDGHHDPHARSVRAAPRSVKGAARSAAPGRSANHEGHVHESAVHGHGLALGSGSVDGVFGTRLHASWQRLFGDVTLQYAARGWGDYDYRFGNDLYWLVGLGAFVVTEPQWTAALRVVASGEVKAKDHQGDDLVSDSGLDAVYVGPGIVATWSDAMALDFTADLPVDQDTSGGRQLVADWRLRGGLTWRF